MTVNFEEITVSLEFIGSAILLCFLDLWIIMSNLFVIVSLSCKSRKQSSLTRRLLISLATADLGLGVFVVPMAALRELVNFHSMFLFHCSFCRFWLSIEVILFAASILNVAAIAIDRFLAICNALNYGQITTSARAHLILLTPWCSASLVGIAAFIIVNSYLLQRQSDIYALGVYCTPQDGGLLTTTLLGILSFLLPLGVIIFTSTRVIITALRSAKERNAGVLQGSEKRHKHSKFCCKSVEVKSDTSKRKPSIPALRVHIGGQPCFMHTKNTNRGNRRNKNLMSSFSPTLHCGIVNLSIAPTQLIKHKTTVTTVVDSKGTTDQDDPSTSVHQCDIRPEALGNLNCGNAERQRSIGETNYSLKPPKWLFATSPRKSDPEFTNLRNMRRCAIQPVAPRLIQSLSDEVLNSDTLFSSLPDVSRLSVHSGINSNHRSSVNEAPDRLQISEIYRIYHKQAKLIFQFIINCGYILVGLLPYYVLIILGTWSPLDTVPSAVFTSFYWLRFVTIALNPIMNGFTFGELRQSFRYLVYCGRPKQEKKALKRLVMAGLAAGGISFGRPINLTAASSKNYNSPNNAVVLADVTPAVTDQTE